jgi:hypothetical protein
MIMSKTKTMLLMATITVIGSMSLILPSDKQILAQSSSGCDLRIRIDTISGFVGQNTGVDYKIKNLNSGYYVTRNFVDMPPPSFYTCWLNYQFPTGSDYQVCAWHHDSGRLIKCVSYTHAYSTHAYVDFDLSR